MPAWFRPLWLSPSRLFSPSRRCATPSGRMLRRGGDGALRHLWRRIWSSRQSSSTVRLVGRAHARKIFSTAITTLWNYFIMKHWVFPRREEGSGRRPRPRGRGLEAASARGCATGARLSVEQAQQIRSVARLDERLGAGAIRRRSGIPSSRRPLPARRSSSPGALRRCTAADGVGEEVERCRCRNQAVPRGLRPAACLPRVDAVDVGDFVLAAGGRLELLGDADDVVVVEVQAWNRDWTSARRAFPRWRRR